MKTAIYARVSTDDQGRAGTIENQLTACRRFVDLRGWEIAVEVKDEGVSGSVPFAERPGGSEVLRLAADGAIQRVVMLSVDRLTRDNDGVRVFNQLHTLLTPPSERRKRKSDEAAWSGSGESYVLFATQSFDGTPAGEMQLAIFSAIAKFERAQIRARTTAGRERRVREGKYQAPTTPFGYTYDQAKGQIEPDPEQAEIVRQMFEWAAQGIGSIRIAQMLDEKGILPPMVNHPKRKGHYPKWNFSSVYKILTAPRYIGEATYSGQPMPCPAIIDRQTFARVGAQLKRRKAEAVRNTKHAYLLQHLLWCRHCGGKYGSNTKKSGLQVYFCHHRRVFGPQAGHNSIRWHWPASELEERVKEAVKRMVADPRRFLAQTEASVTAIRAGIDGAGEQVAKLEAQLADFAVQEERVLGLARRGTIDDSRLDRMMADIAAERREVQEQLKVAKHDADEAATLSEALTMFEAIARGFVDKADRRKASGLPDDEEFVFIDEETGEDAEPGYETWQSWIREFITKIWVEDDGSLTLEGPGNAYLETVPSSVIPRMSSR